MQRTRTGSSYRRAPNLKLTPRRGHRALASLLTTLMIFLLLMARLRPEAVHYQIGDPAVHTIKATRAASYTDPEATQLLRSEAAAAVTPQYTRDTEAATRAIKTVHSIFLDAQAVHDDGAISDKPNALRQRLDIQLPTDSLQLLTSGTPSALERTERLATDLVRQAMRGAIHSNTDELDKAREALATQTENLGLSGLYRDLVADVGKAALEPNLILDPDETEAKREEARKAVADVPRQLQPGDVVIREGEKVTERHMAMFTALGLIQPSVDLKQAGSLLAVLLFLTLATMLFIRRFANDVWSDDQLFIIICCTLIVVAGLFSACRGLALFEVIGISVSSAAGIFLALVVSPLAGSAVAVFLGALVSLASPGNDAHLFLTSTLAALLGSQFVRPRESRSSTVARAAILAALTNTLIMVVSAQVSGFVVGWREVGVVALGGFLSAILVAGIIAVIERPLALTTPLRLLELQNPNEPLLKRMLTEAPGSYQSCVMVANLAEPAAAAIGADAVLIRTASMYHDIGKLKRAYFFVENQFGAENPHERLSPHLSALVLMSHVKDGMELADEMHLPPVVASVIPQHHGTSLVSFMYQRAQAEAAEGEEVRESDYRYPGPKPQTRENAIIMLADTVEAAARTLQDPTRPRIEALVERLVDARIADGQLDEAPLTFQDITIVKQSFINTVANMFHQRLAYPTEPARPEEPASSSAPAPMLPDESAADEGEAVEVGHRD